MLISYCNFLFYLSYFKVEVSYFIHVLCNVSIFFHVINRFLIVIVKAIVDTRRFQRNLSSGQGCVNNVTNVTMEPVDGFTAVLTTQLPTVTGFIACL